MGNIVFKFNQTKAIEAIVYLAQRVSEADIYGICKLLYLVDKTSLEKYGRFIYGESYVAMKEGATPSKTYDLPESVERASDLSFTLYLRHATLQGVKAY